jgi:Domain of unknown function (DUF1707)
MPASYGPPWGRGPSYRQATNPNLRVSHAERTEVADRLSRHYGDGRLDEEEFNERLDRAMKAKTQADLDGVFADLPDVGGPSRADEFKAVAPQRHRRPLFVRILFIIGVIFVVSTLWHALTPPFWFVGGGLGIPWLLVAVVVFFLWRSGAWHRHRR